MAALELDRERRLGELLSTTLRLFAAHAGVFLSLALLVIAPKVLIVDGIWGRALADGVDADPAIGVRITSTVLDGVLQAVVAALLVVVVQRIGRGEDPSAGDALRASRERIGPALATVVLYALIIIAGLIALIIPGIWLAVRFYLGVQASVLDELAPVAALRRSAELVNGHWWQTFGRLIAAGIVFGLLSAVIGGVVGAFADAVGSGALYVVAVILLQALTITLGAVFATLLFFDLRARRAARGGVAPPPVAPAGEPPATQPPVATDGAATDAFGDRRP